MERRLFLSVIGFYRRNARQEDINKKKIIEKSEIMMMRYNRLFDSNKYNNLCLLDSLGNLLAVVALLCDGDVVNHCWDAAAWVRMGDECELDVAWLLSIVLSDVSLEDHLSADILLVDWLNLVWDGCVNEDKLVANLICAAEADEISVGNESGARFNSAIIELGVCLIVCLAKCVLASEAVLWIAFLDLWDCLEVVCEGLDCCWEGDLRLDLGERASINKSCVDLEVTLVLDDIPVVSGVGGHNLIALLLVFCEVLLDIDVRHAKNELISQLIA